MWLQRVLFNVKARLLSQKEQNDTPPRPSRPASTEWDSQRAQVLQNRMVDLDEKLSRLQAPSV